MERLLSLVGMVVILGIAYALSTDRKAIRVRTIVWGLGLQLALALFVLKTPIGQQLFSWVGQKITRVLELSYVGSEFVFGALGVQGGAMLPVKVGEASGTAALGFVFAFQVLPTIIFVAALFAILYHLGVMQVIVKAVAKVMTHLMGASGAESLNVAASIFMGQTEAPLTVRPFLNKMTQSELMCVMTSGMAHVSGEHHGRLHRVRRRGQAPAGGRDHDRAGHDPARQDVRPGDRDARDRRHREARRSSEPTPTCSAPPRAAPATACTSR